MVTLGCRDVHNSTTGVLTCHCLGSESEEGGKGLSSVRQATQNRVWRFARLLFPRIASTVRNIQKSSDLRNGASRPLSKRQLKQDTNAISPIENLPFFPNTTTLIWCLRCHLIFKSTCHNSISPGVTMMKLQGFLFFHKSVLFVNGTVFSV